MKKRKQDLPLAKPLLQAVSMIFVLISITLSWLIFNNRISLSNVDAKMKKAVNISISCDGGQEWSNNLVISQEGEGGSIPITELSGDGKYLYIPVVNNKSIVGYYLPDLMQTQKSFIEFSVDVKADGPVQLFLAKESGIIPLDLKTNISTYGAYSTNYIAAAVRVALFTSEEPPLVWAPNSTVEYSQENNSIVESGTVEKEYRYAVGTNASDVKIISTDNQPSGVANNGKFVWGDLAQIKDFSKMKPVLEIDTSPGHVVTKKLTIRLWIEGSDREAVLPLLGGKFKINLRFTSVVLED